MRTWSVLAVTGAAFFVVSIDVTLLNVAFDAMADDFDRTSQQTLSWVLSVNVTVQAALLITAGRLADRMGRKRIFVLGLAVFALGAAAAGFAPNPGTLIAVRVVMAVGAAMVSPTSLALLTTFVPPERRSAAIGAWGAIGASAAALGPPVGGVVVQSLGWRWVFAIPLAGALGALFFARSVLAETAVSADADTRLDAMGVGLLGAALGAAALAVVQSGEWGWLDERTLGALGLAVVAGLAFVGRCLRHPTPVLDLELFRLRSFSSANVTNLVFSAGFSAMVLTNVLYLQRVWGWSPGLAGLGISPSPILASIVAPLAGRHADRFGFVRIVTTGIAMFALGMLWLLFVVETEPAYWTRWFPGTLLFGTGAGLVFANLAAASLAEIPPAQMAVASGTNNTARLVGLLLGPALVLGITADAEGPGAADTFDAVYLRLALIGIAAAVIARTTMPKPARARLG